MLICRNAEGVRGHEKGWELLACSDAVSSIPVSSEISDFTPCAHAQTDILHIKYAAKTDD